MTEKTIYAGAEWISKSLRVSTMSKLGRTVADLLGDVFCGIYHLDQKELCKVDWTDNYFIVFRLACSLSTFDNELLTKLVVLAHDRYLRVDIGAASKGKLELMFHLRCYRTGEISRRMPTMEDHLASIRRYYQPEPERTP